MNRFKENKNNDGKICNISIPKQLRGHNILINRQLNKGTAFPKEERITFDLIGKLPERIETLEEQVQRLYQQFQKRPTPLAKNLFLNKIKQSNQVLFYRLAKEHLIEMLPIIYTPTIGQVVETFSYEFNSAQGLYFSYPERQYIRDALKNRENRIIELIIITDGEGVLGIGDWGVGGMDICTGKLMVYTLCGGINPRHVLPIQLDVGTNNEKLLKDPMYLGWRHHRISENEYENFIGEVVQVIQEEFPNVFLHWEDFGRENARKNLERYKNSMPTFNDDMQGTGAITLACILAALQAIHGSLTKQRIVFLGAGTAGCGIADQIKTEMMLEGMSELDALRSFWMVDRDGLLVEGNPHLTFFQKPYARSRYELAALAEKNHIQLIDVIHYVKPTILIGCSTAKDAFNEEIVKTMAKYTDRPIIFPLSNPTQLSEADPQDLLSWTDGRALIATGSPYPPAKYKGQTKRIAQCNNAFIFPGLGLGIIAAQARRVTDRMIRSACLALVEFSPAAKDPNAPLLPDLDRMSEISKFIALAVANQARTDKVAEIDDHFDLKKHIDAIYWQPEYLPFVAE